MKCEVCGRGKDKVTINQRLMSGIRFDVCTQCEADDFRMREAERRAAERARERGVG